MRFIFWVNKEQGIIMAYNEGNATTFNQLILQGLSVEQATQQSGISAAASSYGYGTNSNAGAVIPGAGGTVDATGLTQVPYTQPGIAQPAQSPLQSGTPVASDPRVSVGTPPPPTTGPDAVVADEFTGIDAQAAANTATPVVDPRVSAGTPPPPTTGPDAVVADEFTGIDAQAAAQVASTAAENVVQSDAETARLARLNLDAAPNQSAAETNRLIAQNSQAVVGTQLAQRQAVLEAQRKLVNNGDWRVRLSLAAGANYLYNASSPGILAPLAKTGGVIFPYMPKIDMAYKANYTSYDLTHSNYRGYFYQNSSVDTVNLTAIFTAQDTAEADYLLAVIHFFRSVTKMFYGQDAQRGAPPPLVYLTGLGEYQFAAHPCVVQSFQYNLPNDVDYIRAGSTNINGTNLITRRTRQDLPTNPITGAIKRLENLFSSQGINKGAITSPQAPPTLGKNSPTYVPTKIDCTISLLPMQTRAQVSQVFSLKSFANGDLIKGGFW